MGGLLDKPLLVQVVWLYSFYDWLYDWLYDGLYIEPVPREGSADKRDLLQMLQRSNTKKLLFQAQLAAPPLLLEATIDTLQA